MVSKDELEASELNKALLQLEQREVSLPESSYAHLLQLCANAAALTQGKRVHSHLVANGLGHRSKLKDWLIRMYAKCGSLETARSVFDESNNKNLFIWKSMIAAYAEKGNYREALRLFQRMKFSGVEADQHLFARVLGACASLGDLTQGETIHAEVCSRRLEAATLVATALVNMYGKCGRVEKARRIFDWIQEKDVVCWNAMLSAYAHSQTPAEGVELYRKMAAEERLVEANSVTYVCVLGACSSLQAFEEGQALHRRIRATRFNSAALVQNSLISFYSSCKRLDLARMVFDQAPNRNVVSWNAVIAACVQHGSYRQALELYERMDEEPDRITFATVLGACSSLAELRVGKSVHQRIVSTRLKPDKFLQVALVNMYAKCGELQHAKELFDGVQQKDIVAWNVMIVAYAQQGYSREALELYKRVEFEGIQPDELTVASAVSACSNLDLLQRGEEIARGFSRFSSSLRVQNALLSMYVRCRRLEAAEVVFEGIGLRKDVVSWTGMIAGYALHGDCRRALLLYRKMNLEGVEPNEATLATIFSACSSDKAFLRDGMGIHAAVCGGSSALEMLPIVETAIISMYGSCGRSDLARGAFEAGQQHSIGAWNAIIGTYTQLGKSQEALDLYRRMESRCLEPDERTFSSVLRSCNDFEAGKGIHQTMSLRKMKMGVIGQTALLRMYSKCGSVGTARKIFDGMQQKDVISWNAMIAAYAAQGGDPKASLELYDQMVMKEGLKPDSSTFTSVLVACGSLGDLEAGKEVHADVVRCGCDLSVVVAASLISMYAKCGRLSFSREVFEISKVKCSGNLVVIWNAMTSAYAQHGACLRALVLFQEMICEGVEVNEIGLMSVLVACSRAGLDKEGRMIFVNMFDDFEVVASVEHYVCMVDLLSRSGKLQECEDLIREMPFEPDVVAWVSLLGGCRDNGDVDRGFAVGGGVLRLDPGNTALYNLLLTDLSPKHNLL